MEPSQKLLQELSNLTRNLDVLTKEIKESNKINSESQKVISKSVEAPKTADKTEVPSKQKEGFLGNLEKFFKGDAKTKVEPAGVEKTPQQKGQSVKDLVSSVAGKLINVPKLESGGKISKTGVAMVGEKGPELVKLEKGSTVNPNPRMDELLKMELDDMKKKSEKSGQAKEASKIITGGSKLNEPVTNSFGVKVPKEEIDRARAELKSIPGGDDPDYLEEEMRAFIEDYREPMSSKEISGIAAALSEETKKQQQQKEEPKKEKVSLMDKLKSKFQKKETPGEPKPSAETINKNPELTEVERIKGEFKKAYESSPLGKTISGVKSLAKKIKESGSEKSEMKKEEQTLKSESTSRPAQTTPSPEKSSSESKASPTGENKPSTTSTSSSTPAPKSSESGTSPAAKPADQGISSQDIQDIKSLLSAINTTLNGPLMVKDNKPFRPKSNMLE